MGFTEREARQFCRNLGLDPRAYVDVCGGVPALMRPPKEYRSFAESEYAARLELLRLRGLIAAWVYEGVTFQLAPDMVYTPDFEVTNWDGPMAIVEVKGFKKGSLQWRSGRDRWRMAAKLFPQYTWVWAYREENTWMQELLPRHSR